MRFRIDHKAAHTKVILEQAAICDFQARHHNTDCIHSVGSVWHIRLRRAFLFSSQPLQIDNGFNLRHLELGLSAAVAPYFRAWTTIVFEARGTEIEESVSSSIGLFSHRRTGVRLPFNNPVRILIIHF